MPDFGLSFHHMGLAVSRDDQAIIFLEGMGYCAGDKVYDPEQNVHLRLCTAADKPAIELIMPGVGEGPLDPILKRYNELVYHTCYEVGNLNKALSAMETAGLRIVPVAASRPAILFEGRNVSFYKVMGFGFIELLERCHTNSEPYTS